MKVWIDLSNSPHALLFSPVSRRLEELGHVVEITARDNAQTVELAHEHWSAVEVIGDESPGGRVAKATLIARRSLALRRWARAHRPEIALSHNSYGQVVAARLAGIRVVTAMDFEHQPANHLAFRLAHSILVPEAMPRKALRSMGARDRKVHRYPGLKEELYLGDFEPDPSVLRKLGIERGPDAPVVVIRTPPSRALYHRFENPLLLEVLKTLGAQPRVQIVILPRHAEQAAALEGLALPNALVLRASVDSRSLVHNADLMIGAGGTMTREAALMGVPTLTVFAGAAPAVDRALEAAGKLARLTSAQQVASVRPRTTEPESLERVRERGRKILDRFVDVIEGSRAW